MGYNGRQRDDAWRDVESIALATLRAGKSVLVHCRAGVHRGPAGCSAFMGFITIPFDDCLNRIGSQRAIIDPQAVLNRRGGDEIMHWAGVQLQSLPRPWLQRKGARVSNMLRPRLGLELHLRFVNGGKLQDVRFSKGLPPWIRQLMLIVGFAVDALFTCLPMMSS